MTPIKLLGISGSLRRQSCNSGLLRAAAERLPDGVTLNTADLADIPFANTFAGAFDADGNLTAPRIGDLVGQQMQVLAAWARRLRA
jgi:NAD(P)H-dependent FMN reductase